MLRADTLKILAVLLAAYGLLTLPQLWRENEISEALLLVPALSIYLFHAMGMPGLLEHGGACGWGLCAPTWWGWGFLVAFWLLVLWLAAWGIAVLRRR